MRCEQSTTDTTPATPLTNESNESSDKANTTAWVAMPVSTNQRANVPSIFNSRSILFFILAFDVFLYTEEVMQIVTVEDFHLIFPTECNYQPS